VESLGGTYHQVAGDDIPEALLAFARAENATQLVLGATRRNWLTTIITGPGIGARTIRASGDIDVHIVTHPHMARRHGRRAAQVTLPHGEVARKPRVVRCGGHPAVAS
jgi:K+-sensing histidine kinase KdpD